MKKPLIIMPCKAGANVLLAASVFHFHIIDIPTLKTFLKDQGFDVNI